MLCLLFVGRKKNEIKEKLLGAFFPGSDAGCAMMDVFSC
jgi:hypothetical protein